MRRHRLSALACVLLLVVAACGGSGGSPADDDSAPPTSAAQDVENPDDTAGPTGEDGESLAAFFGWADEDPEAAEARWRDEEARIQESIRQCMAEQGFEYQPMLSPDSGPMLAGDFDQAEWARTHGFGITTWYGNEEEMPDEEWIDPNQEMLDSMSDSQRQAWDEALWGTQEEQEADMEAEIDEETGETIYVGRGYGAGCQGQAYEEAYGDADKTQELWEELQPAMDEMYQRLEADPRVVEANQAWSTCMAEAGYEVASRNDMWETVHQDFQERFDAIVGEGGGWGDPFEGWSEDEINAFLDEKSQEEVDAFFEEAQAQARENVDMDAVRALQQEEIDMAVADVECAEGIDDVYMEVSAEYEADLIAANRDVLEQIRAAEQR